MKRVNIYIPEDLWRWVRMRAAETDVAIGIVVERAIIEHRESTGPSNSAVGQRNGRAADVPRP
jgi:hypothetical protein